jgi:crossover junction endodeoxyribonuclease RuvC
MPPYPQQKAPVKQYMDINDTMKKVYIGIDPGLSGAIVGLDPNGKLLFYSDTPVINNKGKRLLNIQGLVNWFNGVLKEHSEKTGEEWDALAFIEEVHAMPKQGVVSTFRFGQVVGSLQATLQALGVPWQSVRPIRWKRAMMTGAGPLKDKSTSVLVASRIWRGLPLDRKKDHNRAEAALIAEFGRKIDMTAHKWASDAVEVT